MEQAATNRLPRAFWIVAGCFLISGFAALLYETVWLRQFAVLLGTSEQALAVVLAAYMGGLAIGSLVASRVVNRVRRPLLTYGLLEFGIALAALFVPIGLAIAQSIQTTLFGGSDQLPQAGGLTQVLFCFATAFSLILLPTALMGATLPLLARHVVSTDEQLGPRIGLLYAINTAGAVLGTLTAAFLCLPTFGLGKTTWIGAACNVLVFVLVLLIVRGSNDERASTGSPDPAADGPTNRTVPRTKRNRKRQRNRAAPPELSEDAASRYGWILLFAGLSGGVSFCYEIIFTRMLGHSLGGSVYAFATMLSGFLLGIAIGGAIAARLATSRAVAATAYVYAQSAAAICTLLSFHLVNQISGWDWQAGGGTSNLSAQVTASIVALLPTATCLGATFPLAIRIYAKDHDDAATAAARVYGWNVVGAIVGALATGAVILPLLQYHHATSLAVLCNLAIAGAVLLVLRVPLGHSAAVGLGLLVFVAALPQQPENVIRISALTGTLTQGDIVFNHVGKSATVTVFYDRGDIRFQTNGLPESSILPFGSGAGHRSNGAWLSALPPLIRPEAESMLIIGLGGGVAAEHVAPSIKSIDVIELEPAVVDANARIANLRDHDPLADPRVRIVVNDGRNALTLSDKKYDIIVSQPSHPWTAGASHLYTKEFNQIVRRHLHSGGLFLQWMNSQFVDEQLVASMTATLRDVFPHVRMYEPFRGTFMFVGSDQPMRPEDVAKTGETTLCEMPPSNRDYYRRLGVIVPTHLLAMLTLDEAGAKQISRNALLITDERNLLAMRAPKIIRNYDGKAAETFVAQHSPAARGIKALQSLCPTFDARIYARSKVRRDDPMTVRDHLLGNVDDPVTAALIESDMIRVTGGAEHWRQHLSDSLELFPENSELNYITVINSIFSRGVAIGDDELKLRMDRMSAQQRMIVQLARAMLRNDFDALRLADQKLAAVDVDDVGFEMAVRLRIPWRLEADADERVLRGTEAVEIIDQSAPFSNFSGLAWFRSAAAINANRPLVALGTATRLARVIQESLADQEQGVDRSAVSNLQRIYSTVGNNAQIQSIHRRRYQETMSLVQSVLEQLGENLP